MGCGYSKDEPKFEQIPTHSRLPNRPNYIALALINGTRAAALVAGDVCPPAHLAEETAEYLVRRAKNDGQTVTIINGCLYLDYKFAGFLPPSMSDFV